MEDDEWTKEESRIDGAMRSSNPRFTSACDQIISEMKLSNVTNDEKTWIVYTLFYLETLFEVVQQTFLYNYKILDESSEDVIASMPQYQTATYILKLAQMSKWLREKNPFEGNAHEIGLRALEHVEFWKAFKHNWRNETWGYTCLLYTSPSPRDLSTSRMPSSA